MIRFIAAGAMALLLAGCTADKKEDNGGSTPNANEANVATNATAKYEIGKPI